MDEALGVGELLLSFRFHFSHAISPPCPHRRLRTTALNHFWHVYGVCRHQSGSERESSKGVQSRQSRNARNPVVHTKHNIPLRTPHRTAPHRHLCAHFKRLSKCFQSGPSGHIILPSPPDPIIASAAARKEVFKADTISVGQTADSPSVSAPPTTQVRQADSRAASTPDSKDGGRSGQGGCHTLVPGCCRAGCWWGGQPHPVRSTKFKECPPRPQGTPKRTPPKFFLVTWGSR